MDFSTRLKELRVSKDLSQDDLAKTLGLAKSSISMYEKGKRKPSFEVLESLADFFNVDMDYLLGKTDKTTFIPLSHGASLKKVPMLGYAAAGKPLENLNQAVFYVDIENKYDVDFCITVSGDSMIGANIFDGDIIFIKKTSEVANGRIACVQIDREKVCLKRFYKNGDMVTLVSENPRYPPMVFTKDNCESLQILGLAVIKQSEIK